MDKTRILRYPHSISAMGIIGAKGNNGIGVAGINWDVSMMLLKIGAQGTGRGQVDTFRDERAARAIRYAADNGARIINWSGFVEDSRPEKLNLLREAIEYAAAKNVLIVVSAGNSAKDIDLDENCLFPQCFDTENLIRVAEIDFQGKLYRADLSSGMTGGSNYGANRVEIAALAMNYTTDISGGIGTSCINTGDGRDDVDPGEERLAPADDFVAIRFLVRNKRCEEDDRGVTEQRIGPKPCGNVAAVHAGHHHVQQD